MLVSILTMTEAYPEIWDGFQTPDHVERQLVIDSIIIECAEMELLYSDPNILKYIIRTWTRKNMPVWSKLQDTLEYKYNPIWNVEGSETTERTLSGNTSSDKSNVRTPDITHERTPDLTQTRTPDLTYERTPDLTETRTPDLTYERTPDLTKDDKVAGYNSSALENRNQTTETGTDTNTETGTDTKTQTGTDTNTETGTDTLTQSGTETTTETGTETTAENGNISNTEQEKTVYTRGMNIGVMSTQALIKEQREIVKFTVTEFITDSFKNNFCLMVY